MERRPDWGVPMVTERVLCAVARHYDLLVNLEVDESADWKMRINGGFGFFHTRG